MTGRAAGPRLLQTVSEMRRLRREYRASGARVGLVATMGFLHEGHLSLVDRARGLADRVVLSIFVNPAQFGPDEDYEEYPRDLERDLTRAAERGVDAVFAPSVEEIYPEPQSTWVEPGELGARLCGLRRPGHFRGVLTVVAKLFGIVDPDVSVFGRKDFQQSVLVRRMVKELGFGVRIETGSIVRDPDGVALSSRNAYVSPSEREAARSLSVALRRARREFAAGTASAAALERLARETIEGAGAALEYAQVVSPDDLAPVRVAGRESVCAVAARVGQTRLIDNARLAGPSSLDLVESEA